MKIQWLGHAAFQLTESTGTAVVTDPFEEEAVGYRMKDASANIVTVSRNNSEHNAVKLVGGSPVVIDQSGVYEIGGIHLIGIDGYLDVAEEKKNGESIVFKFRMDGVEICHLGDVGVECSPELAENIGSVNILLIPIGGLNTIDAEQAKEYVDYLMPDVVIPMLYRTRDCELDLDKVDAFVKLFDDEQIEEADREIEFDRTDFGNETTKILVFES